VIDHEGPLVPTRPPDYEGRYGEHWEDEGAHSFRHAWGFTAQVTPGLARLGGPVDGYERWVTIRNSMLFVLARLLLAEGRFLLHGAAIRRGSEAALVVGESGTGKSSLAFAAHRRGWSVLGDDMVVVDAGDGEVLARGIPRVPSLPGDVADVHEVDGEDLPEDNRARRELLSFELDTRPAPITCVVVCGHDTGAGRLEPVSASEALQHLVPALVLSALPKPVTAWFPVAARLARGRCVRLLHAAEPEVRLDRAGELLEGVLPA
jgi:hypothetical protein